MHKDNKSKHEHVKAIVAKMREALLLMDELDLEKEFEQNRYQPNRDKLKSIAKNTKKDITSRITFITMFIVGMVLGAFIGGWEGLQWGGFAGFMLGSILSEMICDL